MSRAPSIGISIRRIYLASMLGVAVVLVTIAVLTAAYVAVRRDDAVALSVATTLSIELNETAGASLATQEEQVRHELTELVGLQREIEVWRGPVRLGGSGPGSHLEAWRTRNDCTFARLHNSWQRICAFDTDPRIRVIIASALAPVLRSQLPMSVAVVSVAALSVIALALVSQKLVEKSLIPLAAFEQEIARFPAEPGRRLALEWHATEIEQLARTFNALLERIERMVEREQAFTLNAAHELRTPLTRLRGQLGLVLQDSAVHGEMRERLERAQLTCAELAQSTEALLALSQRIACLDEAVDLADIALSVRNTLHQQDEQRLELRASEAIIRGDAALIRLAVQNLVENAMKYSRGAIELSVGSNAIDCVLEVSDSGPGIPERELLLVREPFRRGSSMRAEVRGTGLGLALVDHVATLHGGRLVLQNRRAGTGLIATLCLPLWTPRASRIPHRE